MTIELWVIVATGSCLTGALVALGVLVLGVHAEVKRLVRAAEAAQHALAGNLRQMSAAPAPATVEAPVLSAVPGAEHAPQKTGTQPPLARLAEAVAELEPCPQEPEEEMPASAMEPPSVEPPGAGPLPTVDLLVTGGSEIPAWNPDRRLLVTRLLGRGKNAEQIAAALRIPLREVEEFLDTNQLQPVRKRA